MKGKIIVYSQETGIGKIITPDHHKIKFSIDEWNDYEVTPTIGQEVEFDSKDANAYNIRLTDNKIVDTKNSFSQKTINQKRDKDNLDKKDSQYPEIDVTLDIKSCLELHFNEIIDKVNENNDLLKSNCTLDYIKMRRFLLTAYNNLIEIDYSFENNELIEAKQKLQNVYSSYLYFKSEIEIPQKAYEKIFLSHQTEYKELHKKMQFNKYEISRLNSKIKTLEATINKKSEKLAKISKRSEEYKELINEIKHLKGAMVDAIHRARNLIEENQLFISMIDNFYKKYYEEFKKVFKEFIDQYEPKLKKIQNVYAYNFDTLIWKKANRSKAIKRFFHQAGIVEEFSSITFLKYYIKTLDEKKMSQKNKELQELLEYLERQKRNVILCLDNDLEFLNLLKEIVYSMDRDTLVLTATQPGEAIKNLKKNHLNTFMVNPDITRVGLEQLLDYVKTKSPEVKIVFISKNINRKHLTIAKKHNISAILKKTTYKDTLLNQIKQFI